MFKRSFDIIASTLGLLLLLPLFIAVSIIIKLDSRGPVFFRQERVGRYGIIFSIHKFRTMKVSSEYKSRLTIGNDSRITKCGSFLRKTKIDELPQLIDVLLGNMSIVGPRPEVIEFIDCYPDNVKKHVLSVRPGITDRASIEMIDENLILEQYNDPKSAYIEHVLPLKQKYYIEYINDNSLLIDLKIIIDTLLKIVSRERTINVKK